MVNKLKPEISWDDFSKLDLRIGTILKAEIFEAVRNPAFKLTLDFGELGIRRSSAQLTVLYKTEQLIGKQVVAVVNFPKKQIATMMSECLILGVIGDNNAVTLLQPHSTVVNGSQIG